MSHNLFYSLIFQSCLVVFFNDGSSQARAKSFIASMKQLHVCIVQASCCWNVQNCLLLAAMETKCKTLTARQAGKSKKLPARVKICLPDLADESWYILWIFEFHRSITKTPVSAEGASEILRNRFLKAQSLYFLVKSYLPRRAGKSKKLPARVKICLPRAGGQAVVSNAVCTCFPRNMRIQDDVKETN